MEGQGMRQDLSEKMWYWELVCECSTRVYDLLVNSLFENKAQGVEELDRSDEALRFRVYFESPFKVRPDQLVKTLYSSLFHNLNGLNVLSCEKKEILDWQSNWKSYFKPLSIGEHFLVRPPWEESVSGKKEIVINPGQGFGTGYHESTYLALEMMEQVWKKRKIRKVIDAGTGSGILAIAALLLGVNNVVAFDIEECALLEVKKNMRLSKLDETRCEVVLASPNEIVEQADCVIANINDTILKKFSGDLCRLTEECGFLVLSGILSKEEDSVIECFSAKMELVRQTKYDDWSGLVFRNH